MNDILTDKETLAKKPGRRNTIKVALFAATLITSVTASADRPAMEDSGTVRNMPVEDTSEARPQAETMRPMQVEAPSSVEIMMQNQGQQQVTSGDVLQLPPTEMQPGETLRIKLLDYPRRGMSMDRVQYDYGQPIAISDSIGKPPITRWTYNDRIVYFEYSTVLHVVAR